ncbi:peptidoglycan DD-metalloendopeptidase family protein, partial [bacterium]|nr:peptidoglycan DD-metalloendopeptidase family protein [bacterium]
MKSRKLLVLLIIFCLQMLLLATRWPLDTNDTPKVITGTFGEWRESHIHSGIDIRGSMGDKVYASEAGTVWQIRNEPRSLINHIIIENASGGKIMYVHIQNLKQVTYIVPGTGFPKIRQIIVGDIFTDKVTEVTPFYVSPYKEPFVKIPWNTEMCEVGIYYSDKERTKRADHLHFGVRNASDEFENPLFFLRNPVDVEEPIIKYVGILSENKSSNIKYHSKMPSSVEIKSTITTKKSGLKTAIIFMPTVTGNIDDDPWISVNGKIKFLINAWDYFSDKINTAAPYDFKFFVNEDNEHRKDELYYWMQFNSSPKGGTDTDISDHDWSKIFSRTAPFKSEGKYKNWYELHKDAGYISGMHYANINDGVWDTLSGNYSDGFYELQFEVSDLEMPTLIPFPAYPILGALGHKKDGFIQVSVDNTVPIVKNITIKQYGSEIYSDEDQFLNVDPTEPLDFSIQFNESMDKQDAKLTVTIKNSDDDVPDEEWILDIAAAHTETKGWDKIEFEDDTWHGTLPAYMVIPCEAYKIIISKDVKDLAGNQINPKRDDKPDRKDDGSWDYETGDDKKEEFTLKDVELPIATGCESNFVNRSPKGVITVEEIYYLRNEGTQKLHIELFIEDLNNPINIGWSDDDNEKVSNIQYGEGEKIEKSISFEIDADGETKFSASVLVAGDEITASTIIRIREAGDACQKTVDQPVSLSYEKGVPEIVINSTPIILTPECTLKTPAKIEVTITVDVGSIESYECPFDVQTVTESDDGRKITIDGTTILGLVIVEATSSDKKSAKARRVIKAIPTDCHEIHTIITPDPTFVQQSKKILITDISPDKIKLLDYELDWSGLQPYEAENYLYEKYEEYYINNIGPSGLSFNDAAYSEQLPTIAKYSFSPVSSPGVYDIIELFSEFSDQGTADFHIYDSLGDERKSIWDKEPIIPGINKAEWNGRDNYGYYVSDGEYTFVMKYSSETDEEICKEGRVIVDKTLPTIDT